MCCSRLGGDTNTGVCPFLQPGRMPQRRQRTPRLPAVVPHPSGAGPSSPVWKGVELWVPRRVRVIPSSARPRLKDPTPHQRNPERPESKSDSHPPRASVGSEGDGGKMGCPASYSIECERSDCVLFCSLVYCQGRA